MKGNAMTHGTHEFQVEYKSRKGLLAAYMPYVKHGGLFIRDHHKKHLGEKISLAVKLIDEVEIVNVQGMVVWISPKGTKHVGFGVQFTSDNAEALCQKIETYLAGMLGKETKTDTM